MKKSKPHHRQDLDCTVIVVVVVAAFLAFLPLSSPSISLLLPQVCLLRSRGPAPWAELVTHLIAALFLSLVELQSWLLSKAVPFPLLLATTWFEIVMHFMTGQRTTCCSFLGWLQRLGLQS